MLSAKDHGALVGAIETDQVDALRELLDRGIDVDAQIKLCDLPVTGSLLVAAAHASCARVLAFLLQRAAAVDAIDGDGMTALMRATVARRTPRYPGDRGSDGEACCRLLGAAGADPGLRRPDGMTALDLAAKASTGRAKAKRAPEPPNAYSVAALEAFYGRTLPAAYRKFIQDKAYAQFDGKRFPLPSYADGASVYFGKIDEDSGALEVLALLSDAGDYDEDAAESLIPFAAIYVGPRDRDAQFLLIDTRRPAAPVVMFEHETGQFTPVAKSIAAFLATATATAKSPAKKAKPVAKPKAKPAAKAKAKPAAKTKRKR